MTFARLARHAAIGIAGLDNVLHGGLPAGRNTLIVGTPGSGKTVLALQFIVNGALLENEPGMMISFEESPERLHEAARGFGMTPAAEANVHFYDGRPMIDAVGGGAFDLGGLIAIVGADVRRLGIKRIAFDGLDALFTLTESGEVTRSEFRRLVDFTERERLTSLICLKPGFGNEDLPRQFDAVEYAADGVIRIGYRVEHGFLQRILRVVKIRNSGFAAGEHPFVISANGFDLPFANAIRSELGASIGRVSTGIPQLDQMMEGGLLRGSTTLLSGLPGTAKSTLGAAFLAAGLKAGERCLLVAFEEPAAQLIANVRSVGIDLAPFVSSGQLATLSLNAASAIADEHYLAIERAIKVQGASLLVIDPVSALEKSGGDDLARVVVERLTWLVKSLGVTAMFTAIANSVGGELESSTAHVSAIADTWIHLSFAVKGGERNRTLTIVKSRGTAHSNQLREVLLSSAGFVLQDLYQIQGDFLLGTARLEREQEYKRELTVRELQVKDMLRQLDERKRNALSRLRDAESELLDVNERMSAGVRESASLAAEVIHDRTEVDAARGARDT